MRGFCNCLFFGLLVIPKIVISQIYITEVNFDVPVSERMHLTPEAHYGEFIELYNFTDKDINLTGWALVDLYSQFYFPENTVIKSQDFLVVAYKSDLSSNQNPIIDFYPSSHGNEQKIIYQNIIVLRNLREKVKLVATKIGTTKLKSYKIIDEIKYKTQNIYKNNQLDYTDYPLFQIDNSYVEIDTESGEELNYTEYPSLHFYPSPVIAAPDPFQTLHVPEVESYGNFFNQILEDNYNNILHDEAVNELVNNTCENQVPIISQETSLQLTDEKKCALYDVSGNLVQWVSCDGSNNNPGVNVGYTEEELQQILAAINVFPNPTTGYFTIQWDQQYVGVVNQIQLASFSGINIFTSNDLSNFNHLNVQIYNHPQGLYIATILLNTGQFLSKNILKH